MKLIFSFLFFASTFVAYSQGKINCDKRLSEIPNQSIKIDGAFQSEEDKNNFLLYSLDNGYFIRSIDQVTSSQKTELKSIDGIVSNKGEIFSAEVLSNPELFNFYNYNFERSETKTVGYNLGNGTVLVFYSLEKMIEMYNQTTINK